MRCAHRYQICLFCYDRIKQDCGNLCPGCRTEYGTSKDPFAKLEVKRAPEPAPVRTPPQREAAPAPKPPLHERQTQQAQHRQQRQPRDAGGGGSAKGVGGGGGAVHARGAQPSHQQNGIPPPPPPRQPPPPPPPRVPPAAPAIAAPKPALSRSSSVESSSAGVAATPRQRPPPGWPAPVRGEQLGGSPLSSVGSGPLPPHIALEPAPPRVDAASRGVPPGAATGHAAAEQGASREPTSWPSLSGPASQAVTAQLQDQEQQQQQQQQQQQPQRILDPQVPPPPMLRNQSAFALWAPTHGGMQQGIAAAGSNVLGRAPGFPAAAPEYSSPQQLLQAGTVQLSAPLPLSGSGRAVLADPIGRNMLAALRLAVQTGRLKAEDAARQLASYLRSRDLSTPAALGPSQEFATHGSGSTSACGGGDLFLGAARHQGDGQFDSLTAWSAGNAASGTADGAYQWHSAAGLYSTAPQPLLQQPQPAKRAGRRPLYARGSSNGTQALQNGDHSLPANSESLTSRFGGLSITAPNFQAGQ